jgi:ribosomal subunit interface protein
MQQPLQITFHGMAHSDAVEERIRLKAEGLERFHDHITSCHVTVEAPHQRHHKGNLYSVRVDLHLPDKDIVIDQRRRQDHAHEDVYVAIRDAFDVAVRQLEDHVRRRTGKRRQTQPAGK